MNGLSLATRPEVLASEANVGSSNKASKKRSAETPGKRSPEVLDPPFKEKKKHKSAPTLPKYASGLAPIYSLLLMTYEKWKRSVAAYLYKLADKETREAEKESTPLKRDKRRKKADGLRERARAYLCCGSLVMVRECGVCGTGRSGTGVVKSAGHPCQLRVCMWCERRRALERVKELRKAIEKVNKVKNYIWIFGTIQMAYDPAKQSEVSAEGLRERLEAIQKVIRYGWNPEQELAKEGKQSKRGEKKKAGMKRPGTAMFAKVELSGTGFVHAHFLYYGPFENKAWLENLLREADPRIGHTRLEIVNQKTKSARKKKTKSLAGAVLEVAKYCMKVPSGMSERWLAGGEREVMHPELAANWEVATGGVRLSEKYGALRQKKEKESELGDEDLPLPEGKEQQLEKDENEVCSSCGVQGEWKWATRKLKEWVGECHGKGESALVGSRWKASGPAP